MILRSLLLLPFEFAKDQLRNKTIYQLNCGFYLKCGMTKKALDKLKKCITFAPQLNKYTWQLTEHLQC